MKKIILVSAILAAAPSAQAATIPEVQEFLTQEIENLRHIEPPVSMDQEGPLSQYTLAKFKLRLQAEVGFDIGVGNLKLVPGIELGWE